MRVLINMLVRKKKIRIISRDMIKLYFKCCSTLTEEKRQDGYQLGCGSAQSLSSLSLSLVSLSRYISVEGIRLKIRIT